MIRSHRHRQQRDFLGNTGTDTPVLDGATGKLVVWDGQKAGSAVGILVLPLEGTEAVLNVLQVGDLCDGGNRWPESVDEHKKANAFTGSALSHAARRNTLSGHPRWPD